MENIIFSVNVVLPILLIMVAGYFVKIAKFITPDAITQMNTVVFKVFMPVLIFNNIRTSSVESVANTKFFIFLTVAILIIFGFFWITIPIIEKDNRKRGALIQGIARSNYALFGLPLVTLLIPDAPLAIPSLALAIIIPGYNVLAVIILVFFGSKKADFKTVFISIIKNPLIIGSIFGIAFMVFEIQLPQALGATFDSLAEITSTLALFILGASFTFKKVRNVLKQTIIAVVSRLIIVPLVGITMAIFFDFRGVELATLVATFAAPTSVSSFPMAQKMDSDGDLAGAIVVFTTLFSIVTVFVCVLILRTLGYV